MDEEYLKTMKMIKKISLLLLLVFMMVQVSDAQVFKIGIKGGLGMNSIRIDDIPLTSAYDLATGDNVVGYHVGLQTRVKIAMFFVQPELYFNDGGGTLEKIVDGGTNQLLTVDFKRVDLPVLLGGKIGALRINAGPVGSYIVQESIISDISDLPQDYSIFTNSMTWGFQAGLGLDLSKFSLDVRYEGSLSKLGESINVGQQNFQLDARPSQWLFSLGFWF